MVEILALSATVVSLLAVAILAYPLIVPEEYRARWWRYGVMYRKTLASGLRGRYELVKRETVPGGIVFDFKYKEADAADLALYQRVGPGIEAEAKDLQIIMFWTNRTIASVGLIVALVGGAMAAAAALGL
jgi:hypothetical protein